MRFYLSKKIRNSYTNLHHPLSLVNFGYKNYIVKRRISDKKKGKREKERIRLRE